MVIEDSLKTKMNKKRKWILFITISVLFILLIVWIDKDESFFDRVFNPLIIIYLFYWNFMLKKSVNSVSIYFDKKKYDNIVSDLQALGFYKRKETHSKMKFSDKNKWWKRKYIVIYKNESGIWELAGQNEIINNFEKYIVKYIRL